MKHIKTFEKLNIEPKKGDYVIAYRPKNEYDDESNIIKIGYGKIITIENRGDKTYYGVLFNDGHGYYFRSPEHIIEIVNDNKEAEEKIKILKITNKYNL